jgi:hypothetical protein
MKFLFISLLSLTVISSGYLRFQSQERFILSNQSSDKNCGCMYNGKPQSVGTEVCMNGWLKECKKNSKDECEWLDVGEKCKK